MNQQTADAERVVLTVGRIAAALGQPVHRIDYILRTRPDLKPFARAGRVRVYAPEVLSRLRHELAAQDARRAGGAQ
ncbi:MAG: hypothetical protein JJU36_17950 [Phycisphaeraceae bacterium]|nr:hypothetical protein [Phycisphaeraceae bacterium]